MPNRTYIVRRFVGVPSGHVVDETTVVGRSQSLYAAEHMSANCLGVAVLDPEREVVARFGRVPEG